MGGGGGEDISQAKSLPQGVLLHNQLYNTVCTRPVSYTLPPLGNYGEGGGDGGELPQGTTLLSEREGLACKAM